MELRGKQATVVGLGIEGMALVHYLVQQGASVTVSDAKSTQELQANLESIATLPIRLSLGANRAQDVVEADVVFVSQGVPLDIPALAAARAHGVPFSSMTQLFMARCLAPIVGITGSAGKSTTTALVGEVLRSAGRHVLVGGNIGVPLLDQLPKLGPQSWVVLEISHTQLELTDRSPHVAAITNIAPSHMDRYPTMEEYIALKRRIFAYQRPQDWAIFNLDDPVTRAMAEDTTARPLCFSQTQPVPEGAMVRDGWVVLRREGKERRVLPVAEVKLLGQHNLDNVLAACAAAMACDIESQDMARAVREFRGVEHRLELVAHIGDVAFYNDSIATTPQRTIAGLRSFSQPIVLLVGGREKHLPLEELAKEVRYRCRAVVLFGEAAPLLEEAFTWGSHDAQGGTPGLARAATMEEAVPVAWGLAKPGDVVLLSPACTSFDQFANFEERGRAFKALVAQLSRDEAT